MAPLHSQSPPPVPKFDADTARRFLSYILDTEAGVCEIRVFRAWADRSGYIVPSTRISSVMAGWYDSVHEMVVDLGKLRGVSAYITINPVVPDLFARCANKLRDAKNTTNDGNIVVFRWLYIDIDPVRPADISSTDAELALAVATRDRILDEQPDLARAAIWGRSGNGAWILVMLPDYLPEEGHDLAAQALGWIAATYSDDAVKIDVSTKNPSRVGVIPGTVKCKGDHVPDRPHRLATLDSPDHDPDDPLLPCDLRAWIAAVGADRMQAAQPARGGRKAKGHANGQAHEANGDGAALATRPTRKKDNRVERAAAYLDTVKPAVSGNDGHGQTFDAVCSLIHGFDLTVDEARPILYAYNLRCQPPWNPQELEHKLQEADSTEDSKGRPRGYKLLEGRGQTNGHAETNGQIVDVPGDDSALIEINPEEITVNSQVCALLKNHPGLYQRNYRLVEIARLPQDEARKRVGLIRAGTPMQVMIEGPRLREIISGVATFRKDNKPAFTPDWCVTAVLHRRYWPGLPHLTGIVEHPVIRPNGTMKEDGGYDEETGILCISESEFLPVPENPTRDDAAEAAQRLADLVGDFPFQGRPHTAAWLACLLTILNRHLIDDAVPMFLIEATVAGTGKTLLCDLISLILTGRDMIRGSYYHDAIEMDKRITSIALEGQRVTMLDNVEGSFGNSALDNALTARWYQGRLLGLNSMTIPLLLDSVFIATGNNINFCGDVFRRIVLCRLESPHERPDKDARHKIKDIKSHVLANRAKYLRDALTITRAYIQAGCPCDIESSVYIPWTKMIRGMVLWATAIDPLESQRELAEADMSRMARASFLDGYVEMLRYLGKYEMTGGEIIQVLQGDLHRDRFETIREAISAFWPKGGMPGSGHLGRKLMSMRGSRSGDFRLLKTGMHKHTAKWGLQYWVPEREEWTPVTDWRDVDHLFDEHGSPVSSSTRISDSEDYEDVPAKPIF